MIHVRNKRMLIDAWKIGTGGSGGKPYYHLKIDGLDLGGERLWNDRWDLIKKFPFQGKRILELGCNVGLFSIFALEASGAVSAVGVDLPNNILMRNGNPRMHEAAQKVNAAFGSSVLYKQVDFNKEAYEQVIGTEFDVAICMSFLKWVDDKKRLLNYLSNFEYVIFEGHDSDEVEIARFAEKGFKAEVLGKTQIGKSYPSDAYRTLISFHKEQK